jgi:hypothetical protein
LSSNILIYEKNLKIIEHEAPELQQFPWFAMDIWTMQMTEFQENSVCTANFIELRKVLEMVEDFPKQNKILVMTT